eukprot:8423724-Alexandrium_andersonii.AAC.1
MCIRDSFWTASEQHLRTAFQDSLGKASGQFQDSLLGQLLRTASHDSLSGQPLRTASQGSFSTASAQRQGSFSAAAEQIQGRFRTASGQLQDSFRAASGQHQDLSLIHI